MSHHEFIDKLVIAISSRALFDLSISHAIFENEGVAAFSQHQINHENEYLEPGPAFPLVKKLANLKHPNTGEPMVEVILLSRNSADTGLRVFNSIKHYDLNITRAAFTSGETTYPYVAAFQSHLFLSTDHNDVKNALESGFAAATIVSSNSNNNNNQQLRIAFDGDSVLFSDEAERIFQAQGLDAFTDSEVKAAKKPLSAGPFKGFLQALQNIQSQFPAENSPLRTALVTARSAPTHERVIHTFRSWNIRIDEAIFLGGLDKGQFLKAFQADFFFDDQTSHCQSASEHVSTAHVPHGVMNEEQKSEID